jgi:hypothetical protein
MDKQAVRDALEAVYQAELKRLVYAQRALERLREQQPEHAVDSLLDYRVISTP